MEGIAMSIIMLAAWTLTVIAVVAFVSAVRSPDRAEPVPFRRPTREDIEPHIRRVFLEVRGREPTSVELDRSVEMFLLEWDLDPFSVDDWINSDD